MDRKQKYDMYCEALKTADKLGVTDKIVEPEIVFDIIYVKRAFDWSYEQAIKWALENLTEEEGKGYIFIALNEEAQKIANEAYEKLKAESNSN